MWFARGRGRWGEDGVCGWVRGRSFSLRVLAASQSGSVTAMTTPASHDSPPSLLRNSARVLFLRRTVMRRSPPGETSATSFSPEKAAGLPQRHVCPRSSLSSAPVARLLGALNTRRPDDVTTPPKPPADVCSGATSSKPEKVAPSSSLDASTAVQFPNELPPAGLGTRQRMNSTIRREPSTRACGFV